MTPDSGLMTGSSGGGTPEAEGRQGIQSVRRAVRMLKVLALSESPLGVPALARSCGLQRTTAWRLLVTLEGEGLVERDTPGGRFRVGYGAVTIAARALDESRATARVLHPVLEALVRATGESALSSVVRGMRTLLVDEVNPPSALTVNWVGKEFPLHTSSMGKVLLAALPAAELDRFLAEPLARLTTRTIIDPTQLRNDLATVRLGRVAVSDEEFELGCVGLSAAVEAPGSLPAAILTVTGPASRIPASRFPLVASHLCAAADLARKTLGYVEPTAITGAR